MDGSGPSGFLKYRSRMARMSAAYAALAPELLMTLLSADLPGSPAHLTSIASFMLKGPGLIVMPSIRLPRGKKRSFAKKWPSGYVARITKYVEKLGAFDLK